MKYKIWHRILSVVLVFALLLTMNPVYAYANGDTMGEQQIPEQGDYNYIRLDSLVQNGRTITTAYYDVNELYRFSSYVADSKGENSVIDFAMPCDGKMTIEIYNGEDFGNMDVVLKEKVTVLATLSGMYKQFTEEQRPLGYLAGYLYEGGGSGSVTEIEDALKAQTDLYKMKKFDGFSMDGTVIPAPGIAPGSVMSLNEEIQDQTEAAEAEVETEAAVNETTESATEPISMEEGVAEESDTFTVSRTVDTDDYLPYLHNFIRWEGRYVEYDETIDAFRTDDTTSGDTGSEEDEAWEPISEGETQVLAPGYYVLVFKYESEDNTYGNDFLLRDYARFLVVRVMDGDSAYPEASAATEDGYSCVILDPGCGYTTMVRQLAGDPVELASGSLNWNYTDLEISGDEPLAFTRTYHSLEADNEIGMGRGWSYSFYYRIKDLRNNLLLTLPTGGTLDFKLTRDGSYKVGDGNEYTLYEYSNGYKLTDESGMVVIFDKNDVGGKAIRITDSAGKTTEITYNGNNFDTVSNDSGTFTFTYSGDYISTITDDEGRTVEYSYADENLISFTNADGNIIEYSYNGSHDLTQVTNFAGDVILQNEYDGRHRVIKQYQPDLGTITYKYGDVNNTNSYTTEKGLTYTIVMDPLGNQRTYTYNADGFVATETDWNGNTTTNSYDVQNHVIAMIDALGHKTAYDYDTDGNLISSTDPEGHTVHYTYDAVGRVTSYTDGNGHKTTYSYDANGNMTVSTDPLGYTEKYVYDLMDQATSYTDKRGNTTTTTYDKMGRVTSVTDAEGRKTSYTYDANGNTISTTDPNGNTSYCEYDAENKLTKITTAEGNVTEFVYDKSGRLIGTKNALGHTTTGTYDADGNMQTEVSAMGFVTAYEYDALGRVAKKTNPDGSSVSYTYDGNGNILTYTDGNGSTVTYTYDALNHLLTTTTPNGGVITNTYNDDGLLATSKDAEDRVTSYEYDGNHNIASITDGRGSTTYYTYDALNRLTGVTDPEGHTMTQVYDENGNLVSIIRPDQGVISYVYDKANQATSMTDAEGNVTTYVYDKNGNLIKETNPLGGVTTYTYDKENNLVKAVSPMDRVVADTDENGVRRTYEYDAKGNMVKYTDGLGNSETYSYDKNGNQISKTDRNGNTYTYTYDALNRVISETDPKGNTQNFTYDKNGRINAVTDKNGNTTLYQLDGNGNIVATKDAHGTIHYFTYDSMNRLTSIKLTRADSVNCVNTTETTLYTYDHRGLVKTEVNALGNEKCYVYDGNGNLIQETDEDGYVTTYEYSPVNLVKTINYNRRKVVNYVYDGTGDLIEMADWNGLTTFAVDLLGRISSVRDHEDFITAYGYDAVGNQTTVRYPDGTQADYWYDKENQVVQVQDFDQGITLYEYDPNGNVISKEYPNYETTYYSYDSCNQVVEMDEHNIHGEIQYKTTYTYDANGNRLSEIQYDFDKKVNDCIGKPRKGKHSLTQDIRLLEVTDEVTTALATSKVTLGQASLQVIEKPTISLTDIDTGGDSEVGLPVVDKGVVAYSLAEAAETELDGSENTVGLMRKDRGEKPGNPEKPERPPHPGEEEESDEAAIKSIKRYAYDALNRMLRSYEDGVTTTYTYDTLGNLVLEKTGNKTTRYRYNNLNQLVQKTANNRNYTYRYDKRGNRIAEISRCDSQSYYYDATNQMVHGTSWEGTTSFYTYNGLGMRVENVIETCGKSLYTRHYVIDYTSPENNDLFVFSTAKRCFEFQQKHVYANGERIELITRSTSSYSCEPTVYVHEDALGRAHYYSTAEGGKFAEMKYDAWGDPDYTNKVIRGDHGEYFYAVFTGHVYDVVLDIYYADARFYDASSRQWMAEDPAKDGLNWYQYCNSNPVNYWDPTGTSWWSDFTDDLQEGWDKATEAVSNAYNAVTETVHKAYTEVKETVTEVVTNVATEVQSFVENPTGYFKELACDMTMYWNANKNQIISTVVGAGALVLTTALATVTGGTAMFVIGMGTGAFQSGLDSYLNQRNSGFAVDWGTVGKETLKGGVISGIAGGVGGVMANVAKPLSFCGKGAMEIAGDVLEHWAIGTLGDAGVGMVTTYVSERFDGKSPQEAFQSTMSSADDILVDSMWTSLAGTAVDSFTAPKCFVAGTMVVTAGGLVAIETIEAGDVVLAANEETGEVAYKEVVRTFVNTTDEITHVTIENAEGEQETIDSTPEHPFYVEGLGWVEASSLHAGMTIWFANGTKGTVEDISNEGLEEPVTVYNFEVEDFHTYFVGENGVLVHNSCDQPGPYSHLEDPESVGEGKDFTAAQKQKILEENMNRNGGVVKSDDPNDYYDVLVKPQKSTKGVTPDPAEWQIDHIKPKSAGGTNSYSNARVISRKLNREKSNKT